MIAIALTDRATQRVRNLIGNDIETADFGLRIAVDPGGCAGYQYSLALAPEADADDVVVSQAGFDVFVNKTMAPLLNGIRIDYVESIAKSGFTFDNPNASDACGCGTSFSASASAERSVADAALRTQVDEALAGIRPYLRSEGGDVSVVDVLDGLVSVRLTGACGSCSMSQATLTGVIERRLKEALPEVTSVIAVP